MRGWSLALLLFMGCKEAPPAPELRLERDEPLSLASSPDGQQLYAAHGRSLVRFAAHFGAEASSSTIRFERPAIDALAVSGDGKLVAVGGFGVIHLLAELSTEGASRSTLRLGELHPRASIRGLAFSPDGRHLASTFGVWRLADRALVLELVAASDLETRQPVAGPPNAQRPPFSQADGVEALSFTNDGSALVVAARGKVALVETQTWSHRLFGTTLPSVLHVAACHTKIAAAGVNPGVTIVEVSGSGVRMQGTLRSEPGVLALVFSPDCDAIAVVHRHRIAIFDTTLALETGLVAELAPGDVTFQSAAWSLSGLLWAATSDGRVRPFRVASPAEPQPKR
jgi:hypothetical protein